MCDTCVDVWKLSLACSEANLLVAQEILSFEEKQRAGGIGSIATRNAFILARAALRCLLGLYQDCNPSLVQFTYELEGKPRLLGEAVQSFSASRSGTIAAFAFSSNTSVGIDVERLRPIPGMSRVIERMFSADEKRQIQGFDPKRHQQAFFAAWTRKEAYAKAIGQGILTPFNEFSVDLNPDEPRPEIRFPAGAASATHWVLHDLSISQEYAAALAYSGSERAISIVDAGSVNQLLQPHFAESAAEFPRSIRNSLP